MLPQCSGQYVILLRIVVIILTTLFLVHLLPFKHDPISLLKPFANNIQTPQFHVVTAHFGAEPQGIKVWIEEFKSLPLVQRLGLRVTIYTKDENVDLQYLQNITHADQVFRRPNVGREAETYLSHILDAWDDLPLFTFFSQAEPKVMIGKDIAIDSEHREFLQYSLKNTTGFMNLGELVYSTCNCGHCNTGFYPLLPQLFALTMGEICHTLPDSPGQTAHLWSQFAVSRDRVRERPRWVYEYLRELITAPEGHWIHDEKEPVEPLKTFVHESSPENPLFGHTLERFWPTLFGCANAKREGCEIVPGDRPNNKRNLVEWTGDAIVAEGTDSGED